MFALFVHLDYTAVRDMCLAKSQQLLECKIERYAVTFTVTVITSGTLLKDPPYPM